jgi:hypothetical protein
VELHTNAVNTGVETPASDPDIRRSPSIPFRGACSHPVKAPVPAVTFWILGFVSRGAHALSSNAGWRPAHSDARRRAYSYGKPARLEIIQVAITTEST